MKTIPKLADTAQTVIDMSIQKSKDSGFPLTFLTMFDGRHVLTASGICPKLGAAYGESSESIVLRSLQNGECSILLGSGMAAWELHRATGQVTL